MKAHPFPESREMKAHPRPASAGRARKVISNTNRGNAPPQQRPRSASAARQRGGGQPVTSTAWDNSVSFSSNVPTVQQQRAGSSTLSKKLRGLIRSARGNNDGKENDLSKPESTALRMEELAKRTDRQRKRWRLKQQKTTGPESARFSKPESASSSFLSPEHVRLLRSLSES